YDKNASQHLPQAFEGLSIGHSDPPAEIPVLETEADEDRAEAHIHAPSAFDARYSDESSSAPRFEYQQPGDDFFDQ
ncbi:hypothetical protein EV182_008608, partial [Spiromyces aspiralis]